jgi:DNA-binding response OmpR family regulator
MDVFAAKLRKYLKRDRSEIVNIHGNGFRLVEQGKILNR